MTSRKRREARAWKSAMYAEAEARTRKARLDGERVGRDAMREELTRYVRLDDPRDVRPLLLNAEPERPFVRALALPDQHRMPRVLHGSEALDFQQRYAYDRAEEIVFTAVKRCWEYRGLLAVWWDWEPPRGRY